MAADQESEQVAFIFSLAAQTRAYFVRKQKGKIERKGGINCIVMLS